MLEFRYHMAEYKLFSNREPKIAPRWLAKQIIFANVFISSASCWQLLILWATEHGVEDPPGKHDLGWETVRARCLFPLHVRDFMGYLAPWSCNAAAASQAWHTAYVAHPWTRAFSLTWSVARDAIKYRSVDHFVVSLWSSIAEKSRNKMNTSKAWTLLSFFFFCKLHRNTLSENGVKSLVSSPPKFYAYVNGCSCFQQVAY